MIGAKLFGQPWIWLATRISSTWVRPAVLPESPAELIGEGRQRVCYVLEHGGLADRLALQQVCARRGLPLPSAGLRYAGIEEPRAIIRLRSYRGFFVTVPSAKLSARLTRLMAAGSETPDNELLLVPVAIYWGRSPDKEPGFFKLAFSERWAIVGRTRKLLTTFALGRNTLVSFSEPLSLKAVLDEGLETGRAVRKVSRILRVHFRNRRAATLGPDLSLRRTLVSRVLRAAGVRNAMAAQGRDSPKALRRAERDARSYAFEIAADCSYPTIRVLDRLPRPRLEQALRRYSVEWRCSFEVGRRWQRDRLRTLPS